MESEIAADKSFFVAYIFLSSKQKNQDTEGRAVTPNDFWWFVFSISQICSARLGSWCSSVILLSQTWNSGGQQYAAWQTCVSGAYKPLQMAERML